EFLVRMYFGGEEEKTIIANWLRSRLSLLENDINQLMSNHKEWRDKMSYTQIIAYEIGLAQFLAEKQVIENKLKELTEKV
ncbi:MAG: PadR family transcriptional regulator, partial [Lachnoanaerobaculum sp.]|nr:PadR family transcriptional regulator [Lachnoanaerobaculum sp.]